MDPMMDENFRIRRHAGALFVPGGAMTVATLMALALAVWGCRTFGVEPGRMVRLGAGGRRAEIGGRRAVTLA